jgi:hypothetical protein
LISHDFYPPPESSVILSPLLSWDRVINRHSGGAGGLWQRLVTVTGRGRGDEAACLAEALAKAEA